VVFSLAETLDRARTAVKSGWTASSDLSIFHINAFTSEHQIRLRPEPCVNVRKRGFYNMLITKMFTYVNARGLSRLPTVPIWG